MVFKNLARRFTRTILTVMGIAVGVAAVVALGAMADGMASNYGSAIGLSNDLLVTQANALDVVFSSLDQELSERIQALPGVHNVDAGVFGWVAIGDLPYFLVYGYEPGSVAMSHYRIVEGKPVTGDRQVALGRRAAETLDQGVDDSLRIYGVPYRIVGIYETGQGMEESGGVVTLEDAQTIVQKQRQVSLFQVGLRANADVEQVMQRIEGLEKEITVTRSSDYQTTEQWTDYLKGFAWGISTIAILIGGLGMMSAMVMSVLERTREIGTLRAMGWSRWRVLRLILGEALALSFVGGLLGIGLGVGLTLLAARVPGVGAFLEGAFSVSILVQGMATALSLGLLGGLYPAWTAANLQPVEALRYEGGAASRADFGLARMGSQSFRNLWRRRTRTLLSAGGIGIGVATLVMLGGLIDGLVGQLNSLAGSGEAGAITVMQRDAADLSLSSLDERLVNLIQGMPQVKSVSPFVLGVISTEELPLFVIGGLDPNSAAMAHYKLVEGRYVERPNEILLGKTAAETYKVTVGDSITLIDNRYRVVGICETGVPYEDGGGMLAMREAQRLVNRGRTVSFIFVDVHNPAQAEQVRAVIDQRFPEARASLSSEFAQSTNDIASTMAIVNVIRFLALLVGGIVVANTMIMSIYERTREIGTLRAMGWSRRRIVGQILQESLYLCLVAATFGALLGVGFLTLVGQIPAFRQFLDARWTMDTFVAAVAVSVALGLLGGFYPAWRASRLLPVEALRYE